MKNKLIELLLLKLAKVNENQEGPEDVAAFEYMDHIADIITKVRQEYDLEKCCELAEDVLNKTVIDFLKFQYKGEK